MTVMVKVGRKKYKKMIPNMFNKLKGFINAQESMWIMVNDAFRKFLKKNKQEKLLGIDCLTVDSWKDTTDVDDKYEMEWLFVSIQAPTYQRELQEFHELDKFESSLKEFYEKDKNKFNVEKPSGLANIFSKSKEKVEDVIQKGIDYNKDETIANFLLNLDIVMVKTPPEKDENSNSQ